MDEASRWVLSPTGMDRLSRAIRIDPSRNAGWVLIESSSRDLAVEARFRHPMHGTVLVRFAHVDEELDRPHLRTPAFRIVPDTSAEPARELVTQLGRRLIRADATWWSPRERSGRDAELIALRAGIRTGIRATIHTADVEAATARYRAEGLHVVVLDEPAHVEDPRPHSILCIARTADEARVVAAAATDHDDHRLGALLGYPECCIRGFVTRTNKTEYDGACAAWTLTPAARLNNLLFGERARYISFEPCSYACPKATATANAIANAIGAIDAHAVESVDARLDCDVAIRVDGVRARVSLANDRVSAATPLRRAPDAGISLEETAFANALVGRDVGERGAMSVGGQEVVVVRFGTGATAR